MYELFSISCTICRILGRMNSPKDCQSKVSQTESFSQLYCIKSLYAIFLYRRAYGQLVVVFWEKRRKEQESPPRFGLPLKSSRVMINKSHSEIHRKSTMDRETLVNIINDGPTRVFMNDGSTFDIDGPQSALVDSTTCYILVRNAEGKLRARWQSLVCMVSAERLEAVNG